MMSVAQQQRPLHLRPPQIEIAILEPQVFAGQLHRRRAETAALLHLLSTSSFLAADFDLAGAAAWDWSCPSGRCATLPVTAITSSVRSLRGLVEHVRPRLRGRRRPASCRSGRGGR